MYRFTDNEYDRQCDRQPITGVADGDSVWWAACWMASRMASSRNAVAVASTVSSSGRSLPTLMA